MKGRARYGLMLLLLAATRLAGAQAAAPAAAPAGPVPPAVDLNAPDLRALGEECIKARQAAEDSRRSQLRKLIQVQIDEADALLKEKKQVGNIKGIAIATQTRQLFETALTNLEANGTCAVPDKVRRELDETLAHFNGVRARIDASASDARAAIDRDFFGRFTSAVARTHPELAGAASEPAVRAAFDALIARLTAPPPPPPAATNAPPAASGTNAITTNAVAAAVPVPEILGESGPAERWVTFARVFADMRGMDVLAFELLNRPVGTNTSEQYNPISQQSSDIRFVSLYPLPARTGLVFRLKRMDDRKPVEVVRWPESRNGFTLEVRTTPSVQFPCPHGFDIQVGGPEAVLGTLFSGAPVESPANAAGAPPPKAEPIVITFNSQPAGAGVWVNQKNIPNLRTPCRFRLPQDTTSVRLSLAGYVDGVFTNQDLTNSRTLNWTFKPDPRILRKTVALAANAGGWTDIATVQAGSRITIDAQGTWSALAGMDCGPEGYPNNDANYRIYMAPADYPRQASSANYGALIWRIGPKGRAAGSGRTLRCVAEEAGTLQVDINEAPDSARRADNGGALTLSVVILPPP